LSLTKKFLAVVQGPTAIGKTALTIALAKHYDTEIISADSRQFYKEMRIGTAIPSPEELSIVKHHFIHHISIEEFYTAGDFERDTLDLLDRLFQQRDIVFLTGGSGLYVDAVLHGFDNLPSSSPEIRENLNKIHAEQGISVLQQMLKEQDFDYYQKADIDNPKRLIRALEVIAFSGKKYSSFFNQKKTTRNFTPIKIGLTADRKLIYERIEKRVDVMMSQGLLDEAQKLYSQKHLNALQTVGYRELFDYMEGKFTLEEAVAEIKKNTRRYAKRQLTWLRKDEEIKWFDYQVTTAEVVDYINSYKGKK
jgi:tRNA dimethylallyltransferase